MRATHAQTQTNFPESQLKIEKQSAKRWHVGARERKKQTERWNTKKTEWISDLQQQNMIKFLQWIRRRHRHSSVAWFFLCLGRNIWDTNRIMEMASYKCVSTTHFWSLFVDTHTHTRAGHTDTKNYVDQLYICFCFYFVAGARFYSSFSYMSFWSCIHFIIPSTVIPYYIYTMSCHVLCASTSKNSFI